MKGYNLPDDVSPNDPDAPWNQGGQDEPEPFWCIDLDALNDLAQTVEQYVAWPSHGGYRLVLSALARVREAG